jgi:hypothetical protein
LSGQCGPVDDLVERHKSNGVLIDTNLLLLLALGKLDRRLIGKGRISGFVEEDYKQLNLFGGKFQTRLTTPNILTEVDNLCRQDIRGRLHEFKSVLKEMEFHALEKYIPTRQILANTHKDWFGLTDHASLNFGAPLLLVTTDSVLWNLALISGIDAINWNHMRQEWL